MSESAPWALANYVEMTTEHAPRLPHEIEAETKDQARRDRNLRIRRKLPKVA